MMVAFQFYSVLTSILSPFTPQCLYPFIFCWAIGLFRYPDYYIKCYNEHR